MRLHFRQVWKAHLVETASLVPVREVLQDLSAFLAHVVPLARTESMVTVVHREMRDHRDYPVWMEFLEPMEILDR